MADLIFGNIYPDTSGAAWPRLSGLMRLILPFVFELDVIHRHGRKVKEGNFWDLVEVDITEVDELPAAHIAEHPDGRHEDHIRLWNGAPVRFWPIGDEARHASQVVLQVALDRLRHPDPRNGPTDANLMPAPPYMGSRRMDFVRNAYDPVFQRYEGLPSALRSVEQDMREVRWLEAQRFYARSLVCWLGNLYVRVPEPVWHVRKMRGAAAGYDVNLQPRPNFLTAYREFRLDRFNDAVEFIHTGLETVVQEFFAFPTWSGAFELRRSDPVELAKSTIAAISDPAAGDESLRRLHSGSFSDDQELRAVEDAHTRLVLMVASNPELAQTPKFRVMAARWEFEFKKHPELVTAPELGALGLDRLT